MGIRYDVLMTLPPSGNGQRTRLALQTGDDGIVRPAVLRMLMEGVTPFTATAGGDVLGLIDVITLDDGKFGVFELVPGATLRELCEVHAVAKRLPALGLSGRVVVDAAKAMGALHREATPIAHGGISDAALLAGFDGTSSVLDLGAPRSSRMMAPEQLRGSPATPATDVFCLGAAMHAALTGYDGPYASAVNAGLDTLPWEHRAGEASDALDQVLREALHPAPNMRWPDALAFAEQLEGVLGPELIGKDALATVIKTLFKDRQAAIKDAIDQRGGPPPGPKLRGQMVPRSSRDLPIVSAVVDAAPPAPPPPPRASRDQVPPPRASARNVRLDWPEPPPDPDGESDQKTIVGPASKPEFPADLGTAPAGDSPPTVNLRGVTRPSGEHPPPRPSLSRPPRASPAKAPQVVKLEENPSLGEADDAPTGADHAAIIDESDLSHVPEPPEPSDGVGFDPGATTPGHKLKVPVPKDFVPEPTGPVRRLSTGLQVKMQSEEEKEAARGQEKISTADLDPDERDDGLGGEAILDQPTNIRPRPKLPSDSVEALPAEPSADEVQGDPTEPPTRLPQESAADLEAAGVKKKSGSGARAVIALLLLAIAGGSGYVVLMRPDLVAKVKARIAVLRGQQPLPPPEEQPVLEADAGEATAGLDGGEAPAVVPAPAEPDAGEAADAGEDADDGGLDDGGIDDGGADEDDEAVAPPAKDAGTRDAGAGEKKPKKVKKKRRR